MLFRSIGDDAGVMPALARGIVHQEHVVAELLAEAELRLVLRPVSYTHLRGCLFGKSEPRAGQRLPRRQPLHGPQGGTPVSYTHLDVYKRQVTHRGGTAVEITVDGHPVKLAAE